MRRAGRHVLYWANGFWPYIGGIEVRAARLVSDLSERGYEFAVVSAHMGMDLPDIDNYGNVPVHRFDFQQVLASRDLARFSELQHRVAELKRTFRPDLVYIDFLGPSCLFHLQTERAHPAPLLVTVQQGGLGLWGSRTGHDTLLARILSAASWVTFCSRAAQAEALSLMGSIPAGQSVVYNGVATPGVAPAPLPFNSPVLLCVGRLSEEKGFDLAVRALAMLVPHVPQLRLVIAGDGPARAALAGLAVELGVASCVDVLGWVPPDGVADLINAATLVLCPSRRETFGLVAVEAALMCRPVVATRIGGLPEVVVDGETGLLVEPEDEGALAAGIGNLLDHPDRARALGERARRRVQWKFGWDRHVAAYEALYTKLVEEADYAQAR